MITSIIIYFTAPRTPGFQCLVDHVLRNFIYLVNNNFFKTVCGSTVPLVYLLLEVAPKEIIKWGSIRITW